VADGIFFQAANVSRVTAQIQISNEIVNSNDSFQKVFVKNVLLDCNSKEVLSLITECTLNAYESCTVENLGTFIKPDLWSPEHPVLYTLETYLQYNKDSNTKAIEWNLVDSKKVGIRSIEFHLQTGFYLNGISTKLKGGCVHHDAGCLGAAVLPAVWIRRLDKLKEMGCNAIRMSHNPHMPELYDLCDAMGFFVMDEAFDEWKGVKNKWSTGHNVYPPKLPRLL
jgi:beta-galactosidase